MRVRKSKGGISGYFRNKAITNTSEGEHSSH